jgi:hypothetical protein
VIVSTCKRLLIIFQYIERYAIIIPTIIL